MEGLDSIARRYGVLPSQVLRIRDALKAICIDKWAHNWGVQREALEAQKMRQKLLGGGRHGR